MSDADFCGSRRRRRGGSDWNPTGLFTNGEQGAWYDPSDLSTMFQDAVTPVTAVEQPVAIMLDKKGGYQLGPELVTNGDFSADANWTKGAGWTIANGVATFVTTGVEALLTQANVMTVGKLYFVSYTVTARSAGGSKVYSGTTTTIPTGNAVGLDPAGTYSGIIVATSATLAVRGSTAGNLSVDNVSVKEILGNHAYTPSSASTSRPVLSARVNLLARTEEFDHADWQRLNRQILAFGSGSVVNATTAPNGTTTADLVVPNTSNAIHYIGAQANTSAAGVYKIACYAKPAGYSWVMLQVGSLANGAGVYFNVSTGQVGSTRVYGTGFSASSPNITAVGNGWYFCEVVVTASSALGYAEILFSNGNGDANLTFAGNGTDGIYIWGADLRVTNDGIGLPVYQRVTTSTDYDTTGFPLYLRADGSDDYMLTPSIDFSATDKMTVVAGVRKLTAVGTVSVFAELSAARASNNGAWTALAPSSGANEQYIFASKGTADSIATATSASYAAPVTNVFSGIGNIGGDSAIVRLNGVEAATSATDQGTGNFGNYPLYLFRRGGTASPFNGRFYGLVVRGAATDTATLQQTETYLNGKTRAF